MQKPSDLCKHGQRRLNADDDDYGIWLHLLCATETLNLTFLMSCQSYFLNVGNNCNVFSD